MTSIAILSDSHDNIWNLEKALAAVNEAVEQSQGLAAQQMQGLTGGLNIPGLT